MNFQIETTSHCDLTCVECPNRMMERKRQFIDPVVWERIIDAYVVPFRSINANYNPPTLIPHKDGEPLLNKNLSRLLSYAAGRVPDMNVDVYSHGLRLTLDFVRFLGSLPNRCRLLLSFHFLNHDGTRNDYAEASQVIRDAIHGRPGNLEIILATHRVPGVTDQELEEWRQSWSGLGVTVATNGVINPWTGLIDLPGTLKFNQCPYDDFSHMFFGVTGNVVACCMDLEEEIVFGNVMADDPDAMLAVVRDFYAAQARREAKHSVCNNCFGLPSLVQIGA